MKSFFSAAMVLLSIHAGFSQRDIATFTSITTTQAIDGKVFFVAAHDIYGIELFVSDGGSGNATLLRDINPGYGGSSPSQFTVFNNQLFFTAYSPDYGLSLWKSDGTIDGTQLVYGVNNADPYNLMVFKGKLYFTTNLGSLIRTDGTPAGTQLYYQSEYTWSRINTVVKTDQYIYFSMDGRNFLRDDGSSRVEFLGPLSWEDVYFRNLFVIGNTLVVIKSSTYDGVIRIYSIANDVLGEEDYEWTLIKKLDAPTYGSQEIDNFTTVSDKLFFSFRTYYDNVTPTDELWICDGTEAGTEMLKSFRWDPHYYQSEMGMFFSFRGQLYFRGGDPVNRSLWTSDGTRDGTLKLHNVILTAPYNDERIPVLVTENKFYFSGREGDSAELWTSDGSADGTTKVLNKEDDSTDPPHDFSFSNDVLYFVTSKQFSSTLWSTVPAPDISVNAGGAAIISGSKSTLLFYGTSMGSCKSSNVYVKNNGLEELYLNDIYVTGKDFYLVKQSLPEILAPGETVILQVIFNPVSEDTSRGALTILSNDNNEPRYVINFEITPFASSGTEICQFSKSEYVRRLEPVKTSSPIVLSNASISEDQPPGTIVGELSAPVNATFTLVPGEGAVNNQSFFIEGNVLKSNTVFNFNLKNLYSIRVRSSSQDGETEASFRIRVLNASFGFTGGSCLPTFEQISFAYTSLEVNADGHLFATTNNGKILRSLDDGQSWDVVFASNFLRLSGITFKGNTGYAQGGSVLVKSEDSGATWFQLYIPFTGEYYSGDLAIYFFSEQEGYVGTDEGEVFFTADGGRTWETRMSESWNEFRDFHFLSKDKGYAIVGWGDLYYTSDGGRSWSAVDLSALGWNKRVRDIWFINSLHGFLIGEYKTYKTSDGGKSWIEITSVYSSDLFKIKFLHESLGFLYGANGIMFKTNDGGNNWEIMLPEVWAGQMVGIAQFSGMIFRQMERALSVSSDEGMTWSLINYFSGGPIYTIDFSRANKGVVLTGDGMYKTADYGLSWNKISSDISSVSDVYVVDENTFVLVSEGDIYKSTDGGTTTRKVLTTERSEIYLPAGKLYNAPDNLLFSISWYAIYRSDDLGETWTMVSSNPAYYNQGMHFISASIGYRMELHGSIEKSTDGGKTWTEIFTRDPEASIPYNALFFLNENIGYKGGNVLERTSNGGIGWEKVNWPFYDIIHINFENEDHGYVVTRNGYVYETKNAGSTWETILYGYSRLSDVQFHDHEIFLAGDEGFIARMKTGQSSPSTPGYIYGPTRVCAGDAVDFHVSAVGGSRTQWNTTAGNLQDYSEYITVSFPNAGEFTVSARHFNACGASEWRTTTINVSEPPGTPIIEGPNPSVLGEQDVLYAVTNAEMGSMFLWNVDGSSSTLPIDNHIAIDWPDSGERGKIQVLEVDAFGCRSYGTFEVTLILPVEVEEDLQYQVRIYPNPAEADVQIVSSYGEPLFIRLRDTFGREVSQTVLSGNDQKILLTRQLSAGLYFVEISDGRRVVTKKLIKR